MYLIMILKFGDEYVTFALLSCSDRFSVCLFHETVSSITLLRYMTDLTGSKTKS